MQIISSEIIKNSALEAGFSFCGISNLVDFSKEKQLFEEAIQNGYHAQMGYLERNIDERFNIEITLPDCKSVIVTLFNYNNGKSLQSKYRVSKYAFVRDYHQLVVEQLEKMVTLIKGKNNQFNYKISVDSGRISEKNWSLKAGLGYYGKNGVFLTPQGSFFFIGIILIDQEVDQYDQALPDETNFCGQCSLCMDNCPTKAIVKPYVVDARKCLSYQTLSNKNPDYEFIKGHPWIYGCDICQEVCPKNKKSVINELAVSNSSLFLHFQDSDFENMTKEQFDHYFANTSIGSKGYEKLIQFIKNRQQ